MTEPTLLADTKQDLPVIDESKNYLEELVGEGKKYKDPEALAKKAVHADIHISNLERRLDEMREDYKKLYEESKTVPKLQELIEKLGSNQQVEHRQEPNVDKVTDLMDETKLDSYFESKFQKVEQTRRQNENYKLVENTVKEAFGENYKGLLRQRAESLGLTDDDVTLMAKANPNLFFKTFDVNKQPTERFQSPPASAVRNNNFEPRSQQRTMKYYEDLRKKNPKLYFDPKIAIQMDKDALAIGEAFFDT